MRAGVAWPSSARVVRCLLNFANGRNPYPEKFYDYLI